MRRRAFILVLVLAVGIGIGLFGSQAQEVRQTPFGKSTSLLRTDWLGMEGKEVILTLVEFNPSATTGKHYHPGPEVVYILEGSSVLELEGMAPRSLKPGDSFYAAARQVHENKNVSTTSPLKLVLFRIHEKGQPISVQVK